MGVSAFYIVVCRLEYDDEDSCLIIQAATTHGASREAERQLRASNNDKALEFYVNYIVRCESEPEFVLRNV